MAVANRDVQEAVRLQDTGEQEQDERDERPEQVMALKRERITRVNASTACPLT